MLLTRSTITQFRRHTLKCERIRSFQTTHLPSQQTNSPSKLRQSIIFCSGGGWNSGGRCQLETLPYVTTPKSVEQWADMLKPVNDVLGNGKRPKFPGLDILNVTQMTAQRKDGHLSVFSSPFRQDQNNGTSETQKLEDCSHWCLPGIPDTWNELLYAVFMRRQMMSDQNVPLSA